MIPTENDIIKLTYSLVKYINHKMHFKGIFCNMAKAFGCTNHEIFLDKLHFHGILGLENNKLATDSSEAAYNFFSNFTILKHGVPKR